MLSLTVLSLGRIPSRFFLQEEKAELGGRSQPPQIASGWFRVPTELLLGHSHRPPGPDWSTNDKVCPFPPGPLGPQLYGSSRAEGRAPKTMACKGVPGLWGWECLPPPIPSRGSRTDTVPVASPTRNHRRVPLSVPISFPTGQLAHL